MTSVFNQVPALLVQAKKPAVRGRPSIERQSLQMRVLLMLAHKPGVDLYTSRIVQRCGVDRKTVTDKLRALRKTGWVTCDVQIGALADPAYRAGPKLLELLGVLK
jgi:DNA-binding IclR family transcriptional regulator